MKSFISFIACLAFGAAASGQQTVAEFNWKDLATGAPRGTAPVSIDGREALKIENTNAAGLQLALLTIDKPKISGAMYVLEGEIRYDGVQGDGFLEMWNYFSPVKPGLPEGEYFSRTMGESGEMGKIRGTSDWRPFKLPFDSMGTSGSPTHLQFNLVLRGSGTVYLGPLKLTQYTAAKSSSLNASERVWFNGRTDHPWWSARTGTWAGALGGVVIGCLGGLVGWLASKGRGRTIVIGMFKVQIVLGVLLAVAGIVAFAQHQPYAVWYPLGLFGILELLISPPLLISMNKIYQQQELRRMQALDAAG